MLCLCLLPACGDSNGDEPDNPNPVNPDKEVADPAGTVKLSMRSEAAAGDGKTTINNNGLWIDAADNFYAHRGYIVDIGAMKGLGNVGYIPKTGYVSTVAVTPGDGYIWATEGYNDFGNYEKNVFYRIYVTNYTQNSSGEIIGADVKYQKPFYGKDEALKPSDTNLSVSGDGGSAGVVFENNSVIPFTVESDKAWVKPQISSTLDHSFLPNAITFYVSPATTTESETATVTATTYYKKSTKITITRLGVAPKLSIPDDAVNKTIDANATEYRLPITTNLDFKDLTVKSSADWATVELVDGSSRTAAVANSIRWIGNEPVTHSRANTATVRTYYALVKVAANVNSAERKAAITVSSKDGKLSAKQSLTQKGATISVTSNGKDIKDGDIIDVQDAETSLNIKVESSVDEITITSDKAWAEVTTDDEKSYTIKVAGNETPDDRSAKIYIKAKNSNLALSFTLKQAGGTLSVKGLDGSTTYYVDRDTHSYNYVIEGSLPYSVKSNADWCTIYQSGNNLAVTVTPTTETRSTTVEITGGKEPIILTYKQTKYKTGDYVTIDGKKSYLNLRDGEPLLYYDLGISKAWSTQYIVTGAVSRDDGEENTRKIHSIQNWQNLYPAFKAIDELNSNGNSEWYMPAIDEINYGHNSSYYPKSGDFWTSTEYSTAKSHYCYCYNYSSNIYYAYDEQYAKDRTRSLVAVKKFNAFDVEDNE